MAHHHLQVSVPPILAVYGDNLMKFAPVLGEALADAAINGTTPTVKDLVAA